MLRWLVVVALVCAGGCAFKFDRDRGLSPGEIQGRLVRSDDANKPAAFARITVPGSLRVTRALKDGTFRLQGLPPGPVAIKFADDANGDGIAERGGFTGVSLPVDNDNQVGFVILGDVGITGTFTIAGTVKIDDGNGGTAAPSALGLVARVFATRGECFGFTGETAPQGDCTTQDPNRIEIGAEAVTSADATGAFELDGITAGHVELSVILSHANGNAVGPVVDVSLPLAVAGKAGDHVSADPIVFQGVAATLGTRIVTIAPNPPAVNATVVLRTAGLGTVNCNGARSDLPADAIVFDGVLHDGAEAAILVPFGAYDVTVCGADGLSGTSAAQLALPPTSDTDVPTWQVLRFDGDPCTHIRGGQPVTDCDDDNFAAIPPLTPAVVDLYTACIAACSLTSDGTFDFNGATLDCDDDADGQPDCTEPNACQGPGHGTDLDGDFSCTFQDPAPTCASNDPAQCTAGTNDVTPGDPTHPPAPAPGLWVPGPPLPNARTAGEGVVMPFVDSLTSSVIGFAIVNTRTNGTADDDGVAFRFATQSFETIPVLSQQTTLGFTGAAEATVIAFGSPSAAAVGGIGPDGTVSSTARLFDAFDSGTDGASVTVETADIHDPSDATVKEPTAFGALSFVLGSDPANFQHSTERFLLAGGVDGNQNLLSTVFLVDPLFVSTQGQAGFIAVKNLVDARKNAQAIGVEQPAPLAVIIGGDGASGPLASIEIVDLLNPDVPQVFSAGSLHDARTAFTATGPAQSSDARIVVVGGRDVNGHALSSIELITFDANANATVVASTAHLIHARSDHAATQLDADRVLITGGFDDAGAPVAAAELYRFSTDAIEELAARNTPLGDHRAVPVPDGSVIVVGGKDALDGNDVGTTEVFTPIGLGEGEGEGEGGEGEGEGGQVACATASTPTSPATTSTSVIDEAVAGNVVFFADVQQGVLAATWDGTQFGASSLVVNDTAVTDLTVENGFVVASAPSTGFIYVLDPADLTQARDSVQVTSQAGFVPQSTITLGPAGSFGFEFVMLDANTHNLERFNDGDGIIGRSTQTRDTAVVGNGDKLWFVDDGASGQVLVQNLGTNGGFDEYPLANNFPEVESTQFTVGSGSSSMDAFTMTSTQRALFSEIDQSQTPPLSLVQDTDPLSAGTGPTLTVFVNGGAPEGAALAGSLVVVGLTSFTTGATLARVADVSTPGSTNILSPDLTLAAGAQIIRAYTLDSTHVMFSGGTVVDVSGCSAAATAP